MNALLSFPGVEPVELSINKKDDRTLVIDFCFTGPNERLRFFAARAFTLLVSIHLPHGSFIGSPTGGPDPKAAVSSFASFVSCRESVLLLSVSEAIQMAARQFGFRRDEEASAEASEVAS